MSGGWLDEKVSRLADFIYIALCDAMRGEASTIDSPELIIDSQSPVSISIRKYVDFPHPAVLAELNGKSSVVFFVKNNYARDIDKINAHEFVHDVEIYSVPQSGGEVERVGVAPEGDIVSVFFVVGRTGGKDMYVLTSSDGTSRGLKGEFTMQVVTLCLSLAGDLLCGVWPGIFNMILCRTVLMGLFWKRERKRNVRFMMQRPRKNILKNWALIESPKGGQIYF